MMAGCFATLVALLVLGVSAHAELLFQSGFNASVAVEPSGDAAAWLTGRDQAHGADAAATAAASDWGSDGIDAALGFGRAARIYYEGGTAAQRGAEIATDEADPSNSVLRFWLAEPNVHTGTAAEKGRVQLGVRNDGAVPLPWIGSDEPQPRNLEQFFYSVRFRLEGAFELLQGSAAKVTWLTLAEFWNDSPGDEHTFRITFALHKEGAAPGSALSWHVHAQTQDADPGGKWNTLWERRRAIPAAAPPVNEWMTLRVFVDEGRTSSPGFDQGRFVLSIEREGGARVTVADVEGPTCHPDHPHPDGFRNLNPLKLYTSGGLLRAAMRAGRRLQVSWDDFALSTRGRTPDGASNACDMYGWHERQLAACRRHRGGFAWTCDDTSRARDAGCDAKLLGDEQQPYEVFDAQTHECKRVWMNCVRGV